MATKVAFSAAIAAARYENDMSSGAWAILVWDIVGQLRARSHCHFVLALIDFITYSLT
jgi:hypothetical protein